MNNAIYKLERPHNEPAFDYVPGSSQVGSLMDEISRQSSIQVEIPLIIGGREIRTGNTADLVMPHDHHHKIGFFHKAGTKEVDMAIEAALDASGSVSSSSAGSSSYAGGIVGNNIGGTLSDCDASGRVTAASGFAASDEYTGGVIGYTYIATTTNNTFTANTGQEWGIGWDDRKTPPGPSNDISPADGDPITLTERPPRAQENERTGPAAASGVPKHARSDNAAEPMYSPRSVPSPLLGIFMVKPHVR